MSAASDDSTDNHSINYLDSIIVKPVHRFNEIIPSLTIEQKDIERLSPFNVADVLRCCAGIQIKDYGGIGGVKTINVRSMGSQHTGVFYDGAQLSNAQNGQIDLGQFSMENIESIAIHQGQRSAIFQSASEFGHASTLYLRTRVPVFSSGKHSNIRLKLQGGSFDLQHLSAVVEHHFSNRISGSFHLEELTASGKYRFRYRRRNFDGTLAYDTTATRHNGDVQSLLAEANIFGNIEEGSWQVKAYSYLSNRGIPGAIVNNVWRGGERQSDNNIFVQGKWLRNFGSQYSTRLQGKYAHYGTHYVNNDSTRFLADNTFRQQEAWISSSHVLSLCPDWDISASYDLTWNHLHANLPLFDSPQRFNNQLSIATAFNKKYIKVQASLLGTRITDLQQGKRTHFSQLSPAFYLRWLPRTTIPLSLHTFAKRCHRMPTFNDLYYTEIGNSLLRPESADLYDVGLQIKPFGSNHRELSLFIDLYHNHIKDKIVAYPKGQQFRWTMLNLGRVDIDGLDINLNYRRQLSQVLVLFNGQYTLQRAIDVTDTRDPYYKDQIPYMPHHSGSLTASIEYKTFSFNYHFTYVGERWSQQENILYNHLQPWYTNDLCLQFHWKNYRLVAEVLNVLDQQYDVIANFPMPGRNFRFSICADF